MKVGIPAGEKTGHPGSAVTAAASRLTNSHVGQCVSGMALCQRALKYGIFLLRGRK